MYWVNAVDKLRITSSRGSNGGRTYLMSKIDTVGSLKLALRPKRAVDLVRAPLKAFWERIIRGSSFREEEAILCCKCFCEGAELRGTKFEYESDPQNQKVTVTINHLNKGLT